jgi:ribonuclease P protein component
MIPRTARLPREEFSARGYHTTKTPFFLVKIKNNGRGTDRIGVVAGITVHKSAAKRNFWKRQAKGVLSRSLARASSHEGRIPRTTQESGNDVLLILSSRANELTKKQFQKILSETIKKTL